MSRLVYFKVMKRGMVLGGGTYGVGPPMETVPVASLGPCPLYLLVSSSVHSTKAHE